MTHHAAEPRIVSAAVMRQASAPLAVEKIELSPPGPHEVRVNILAAGVCHSDLHYLNGDLPCELPTVLGHEGTGVVEAVGRDVENVALGDNVVITWRPRCGHCVYCLNGRPALCTTSRTAMLAGNLPSGESRIHVDGERLNHFLAASCFAEACVVSDQSVIRLSSGESPMVAALLGCAAITGFGAVLNVAEQMQGASVLIIGGGGVGLSAVLAAKLSGARRIVVTDRVAERCQFARSLGATHVVEAGQPDSEATLADAIVGGVEWAFDAVGSPGTLSLAVRGLVRGGSAVALGLSRAGQEVSLVINDLVQNDKRLIGSLYGSSNTPVQIPMLFDMYQNGLAPIDRLLGKSYALEEINNAFDSLRAGKPGRAVILMGVSADG